MCTGFVKKGKDILFGFNLDIDPNVWNFGVYKNNDYFTIGIKVGNTLYYTHGVNKEGHFGNIPYMNDYEHGKYKVIKNKERIDLLSDRFIRNKYSYNDVMEIVKNKTIVNVPRNSMHSLLADAEGHVILVEPEYGYKEISENYAVITNFPLLIKLENYEPWFGKDRYDKACEILSNSDDNFSALDGIALLKEVKQEGKWATRVSFVYSVGEKCVYYVMNNDFDNIQKHYLQ